MRIHPPCCFTFVQFAFNSSFDSLQSFKDEVLSVVDDDKILFFVVGTKNDLKDRVCVDQHDVRKFAKSIGAPSFVVSAVANTGVHGAFRAITDGTVPLICSCSRHNGRCTIEFKSEECNVRLSKSEHIENRELCLGSSK